MSKSSASGGGSMYRQQRGFSYQQAPETTNRIRNAYTNIISKIKPNSVVEGKEDDNKKSFNLNNPNMIRGGVIGLVLSALLSWNAGKYSRLGIFRKRWRFIRHFIMVNQKPNIPVLVTHYYQPYLDTVVKNFMCYSGEAGIGKSTHFMNLAYTQSGIRPALYLAFKASGKDATFYEDLAEQAQYGGDCPHIFSEIILAAKKINYINKFPQRFWFKIFLTHLAFAGAAYGVAMSSLQATYGMLIFGAIGFTYLYYIDFIYPLMIQSFRRTCPVVIFDDLNKIEQMNMFPQIVRYLQLLQNNVANVILISPDQDTWCKLRKEPGMKDRLRVRQIYYDHLYTAQTLLNHIKDDKNYQTYMKFVNGNKLYTKEFVTSLIKELIGKRQVTLRRFTSILILNDQEESERLIKVLKDCYEGKISTGEAVQKFTDILYDSQTRTMVANLKNIKRQAKLPQQQFFEDLKTLLKKRRLPSDNQVAPHLKAYNIVRDLQSQYVFNGRFMFTVFNMAIQEYERDMKQFKSLNEKEPTLLKQSINSNIKSGNKKVDAEVAQANLASLAENENVVKNWSNTNISAGTAATVIPDQQVKEQKQTVTQRQRMNRDNMPTAGRQNINVGRHPGGQNIGNVPPQ